MKLIVLLLRSICKATFAALTCGDSEILLSNVMDKRFINLLPVLSPRRQNVRPSGAGLAVTWKNMQNMSFSKHVTLLLIQTVMYKETDVNMTPKCITRLWKTSWVDERERKSRCGFVRPLIAHQVLCVIAINIFSLGGSRVPGRLLGGWVILR